MQSESQHDLKSNLEEGCTPYTVAVYHSHQAQDVLACSRFFLNLRDTDVRREIVFTIGGIHIITRCSQWMAYTQCNSYDDWPLLPYY